jgi:hypothetical protein
VPETVTDGVEFGGGGQTEPDTVRERIKAPPLSSLAALARFRVLMN